MNDAPPQAEDIFVLRAREVRKEYVLGRQTIPVLSEVTLDVRRGETLCIRGISGAGKTTLLHILGGLERPTAGSVECLGTSFSLLGERRRAGLRGEALGFVFQAYHLFPELTVLENVHLPAMKRRGGKPGRARELLEQVGLDHRLDHRPAELSGGEQQRAALARALINDPQIVLADEPTGNLDSATGEQVLDLLLGLVRRRGATLVLVTHNDHIAERCARSLTLRDGRILEDGT